MLYLSKVTPINWDGDRVASVGVWIRRAPRALDLLQLPLRGGVVVLGRWACVSSSSHRPSALTRVGTRGWGVDLARAVRV